MASARRANTRMTKGLQRLAFKVTPEKRETFDSWLGRLLTRHEIDLRGLLRHLGCDVRLVGKHLGAGHKGVRKHLRASYDEMLGMLAWSVDVPKITLVKATIQSPRAYLLPPSCQVYGCLVCWMEALSSGRPLTIRKEWIYRASWLCHLHDIPLHSVEGLRRLRTKDGQLSYLSDKIGVMRSWFAKVRVLRRAKQWNEQCIDLLQLGGTPSVSRWHDFHRYFDAFTRNNYHFSPARIQLLALAHRPGFREALRFENLMAHSNEELSSQEGNRLDSMEVNSNEDFLALELGRLMRGSHKRFYCDLHALLLAYSAVRQRQKWPRPNRRLYTDHELGVLRRAGLLNDLRT